MKRALGLILALVLLWGCEKATFGQVGPEVAPPAPQAVSPVQVPPLTPTPGSAPDRSATPDPADLLPQPDRTDRYYLTGPGESGYATEYYVRDGERLIGATDGKTDVTWFITESQGVWRPDPKGDVLLRYLPPELEDNLAWKQTSGSEEVWFLLRKGPDCSARLARQNTLCWELTVLNRAERTVYTMAPGEGIIEVRSYNLEDPAKSYDKTMLASTSYAVFDRERLMQEGSRRTITALTELTEVTPGQFAAALTAANTRAGLPFLEVDLNLDGKTERIEGRLGAWHASPLRLFDRDGREVGSGFLDYFEGGIQHRLEVVSLPGIDQPALLYQQGKPEGRHDIYLRFVESDHLIGTYGWAPKVAFVQGTAVQVEKDGTVAITDDSPDLVGYTWVRRYRVKPGAPYAVELQSEIWKADSYPADANALLTAAFLARSYGLSGDLARYIPDATTRSSFLSQKVERPPYRPGQAQTGKLVWKQMNGYRNPVPEIEPGAAAPAGAAPEETVEFMVKAGQWESWLYYVGEVSFGRAADGRLVIRSLKINQTEDISSV